MNSVPCHVNTSREKKFQIQVSKINLNIILTIIDAFLAGIDGLLTPVAYEQLIENERVHYYDCFT